MAEKRQTKLSVKLGGAQTDIISLTSSEAFCRPFQISVDMLSSLDEVDLMPHLGKPAVVSVSEDDVLLRYFHGILTGGEFVDYIKGTGWIYRLTLSPRAHLHEFGRKFRIFQEMPVRDIIKKVLEGCEISADFSKLSSGNSVGSNRHRKYCVQYAESDFNFACRLMEEEGIYYYYEHTANDHILTLCDSRVAHAKSPASPFMYNPSTRTVGMVDSKNRFSAGPKSFIQEWHEHVETGGEKMVSLRDFDFRRKDIKPLQQDALTSKSPMDPADIVEVHDYPGRFYVDKEGEAHAQFALAARRANRRTFRGSSHNAALACGDIFTLDHPTIPRYDGDYLLAQCQHSIGSEAYRSGMSGGSHHHVVFEAVPADTVWRPMQLTPKPVVWGPETAMVTGPDKERKYTGIHCDEYGRIKVQFHWDREAKHDDHSSCWIRVSQTGGLGNMILPRVGHEVLVDFINGDPDRPIVVGRVYNEEHKPFYKLPDHKTRAVWRTKSYQNPKPSGGAKDVKSGDPGANELIFEDLEGDEEIYIHAQRNMNTRIQRDETSHIGNDHETKIGQNRWLEIGKDDFVTVDENRMTKIKKSESRTVMEDRDTVIESNELLKVTKDIHIEAGGSITMKAGSSITLNVGGSTIEMTGTKIVVKSNIVVNHGNMQSQISTGGNIVQTNPVGAVVKGTLVMINSGGAAASDSVGGPKKPSKSGWLQSPPKPERPKVSKKTPADSQSNKQ
jgi:type VI secretion system secreted protein VgrG